MSDLLDFGEDLPPATGQQSSTNQTNTYQSNQAQWFGFGDADRPDIKTNENKETSSGQTAPSLDDFFDSLMAGGNTQEVKQDSSFDPFSPVSDPFNPAPSTTVHGPNALEVSQSFDEFLTLDPFASTPFPGANGQSQTESSTDLDDLFGPGPVSQDSNEGNISEDEKMGDKSPGIEERRSRLKKSTEKSFEDLLQGLTDESDPDLDDIVGDDANYSTTVESLLEETNKSTQQEVEEESSDEGEDEPQEEESPPISPGIKVKVDLVEDTQEEVEEDKEMNERKDESEEEEDTEEVIMRRSNRVEGNDNNCNGDDDTGGDVELDFAAVADMDHLNVDASKEKTSLRKRGSLALRRKPSRKGRKSILSGDEDIFQDSTEPKPSAADNSDSDDNDDNIFDGETEGAQQAPTPAKRPSPAMMKPLPGMTKPSGNSDSKPPVGGFKLPTMQPGLGVGLKKSEPNSRKVEENVSPSFERPALRSVGRSERSPSRSPERENKHFMAGLKSTPKVERSSDSESGTFNKPALRTVQGSVEKQHTSSQGEFEKPQLRTVANGHSYKDQFNDSLVPSFGSPLLKSTPKREVTPMDNEQIFEKPALRSTPKRDIEVEKSAVDSHTFDKPVLKSASQSTTDSMDKTENIKSHFFDKPVLKSRPNKSFEVKEKSEASDGHFEKPALRTVNAHVETKVTDRGSESDEGHQFVKPALRNTPKKITSEKSDVNVEGGVFDVPSLRSVGRAPRQPSVEKDMYDPSKPKGQFEKPALRSRPRQDTAGQSKESEPSWLSDMKLRKTRSPSVEMDWQSSQDKEKPAWLKTAAEKKATREILQEKEKENVTSKRLDDGELRTGRSGSLQDGHMNGESQEERSQDRRKPAVARQHSGSYRDSEDQQNRAKPAVTKKDNYSPAWMRQVKKPSTTAIGIPSAKSDEIPAWKKELALKRKARRDSEGEQDLPRKSSLQPESSLTPPWKDQLSRNRLRSAGSTPNISSTHLSTAPEPEWKRKAEEKRNRLRQTLMDNKGTVQSDV